MLFLAIVGLKELIPLVVTVVIIAFVFGLLSMLSNRNSKAADDAVITLGEARV